MVNSYNIQMMASRIFHAGINGIFFSLIFFGLSANAGSRGITRAQAVEIATRDYFKARNQGSILEYDVLCRSKPYQYREFIHAIRPTANDWEYLSYKEKLEGKRFWLVSFVTKKLLVDGRYRYFIDARTGEILYQTR
jgi:hypothetical protein